MAKLVLHDETGSDLARALWDSGARVHTSILTYPETFSAIVKAHRNGRLSEHDLGLALDQFEEIWEGAAIVELVADIARHARDIVLEHDLSGADAVHVASALSSSQRDPLTFVTWDRRQAEAAIAMGTDRDPGRRLKAAPVLSRRYA